MKPIGWLIFVSLAAAIAGCDDSAPVGVAVSGGDGVAVAGGVVGDDSSFATSDQLTAIPGAFHGTWGFLGDCSDPIVITYNSIGRSDSQPLSSVEIIDEGVIQLDREPNPEYPDEDERFGLSVEGDDVLVMSAPQMSSMRLERCADTADSNNRGEYVIDGLPAAFHGRWDDANGEYNGGDPGSSCDPEMGDISTITGDARVYAHGTTRFSDIRRTDNRTYAMTAQHTLTAGETRPAVEITYALSADGNILTETIEGYAPFIYVRC